MTPRSSSLVRLLGVWRAAKAPAADLPVLLAALIYLRLASLQHVGGAAARTPANRKFAQTAWAGVRSKLLTDLTKPDWVREFDLDVLRASQRMPDTASGSLIGNLSKLSELIGRQSGISRLLVHDLLECVAKQPIGTLAARRRLLADFDLVLDASQGKLGGEYRTPQHVIDLMVTIADPRPGERVYDPCFGAGGLLAAAYDRALKLDAQHRDGQSAGQVAIAGAERSEAAFTIGLARLALVGVENPHLELADSLDQSRDESNQGDGYDLVLANPPWGVHVDRDRILGRFPVPMRDAAGLFVQKALDLLGPDGRAVVVVPEGLLFQAGSQEQLRRLLLERHAVEAVISLPPRSFMPYTAVKSSILVVRRRGPTRRVRMVDASLTEVDIKSGFGAEAIERIAQDTCSPLESADAWDVPFDVFPGLDWDLSVRRHTTGALTRALQGMSQSIPVVPLAEACEVLGGRGFPPDSLIDSPATEAAAPYIRIRDLSAMTVRRPSSWVMSGAADSMDPTLRLRAGDVLLSKSGTIGKVAVVGEEAVGAIASAGLFILRTRDARLNPNFLAAYLSSEACKAWLNSRARGVTIQHLRQGVIAELPVPLPSPQVQAAVIDESRKQGVDAVEYLAIMGGQGRKDAISEWVDHFLGTNPGIELGVSLLSVHRLSAFAHEVRELRNRLAHGKIADLPAPASDLFGWLMEFSSALDPLQGIEALPGVVQYAVFREAAQKLHTARARLDQQKAAHTPARQLTAGIVIGLNLLSGKMLGEAKISVHAVRAEVEAGTTAEIELTVRNDGALPVRDLRVAVPSNWGRSRYPFLETGQTVTFLVRGKVVEEPGDFTLACEWRAQALDGQPLSGEVEVPLRAVRASGQQEMLGAILSGASPYVCGDPIRPERDDVFFGRENLVEDIRRQVVRSGNVILLEGNRRAGKSSILMHLAGAAAIPGWLGIYCSLQGAEGSDAGVGVPTVEVFREIAKSIAQGLASLGVDVPLPDGTILRAGQKAFGVARACRAGIGEASPFGDFREYLEMALAVAKDRGCSLLLMLDEFDKLQEGIDHGITSPQVPENIRFLVQTYPHLSAILTGSRRLKRLREEYWSALFGLGTRFSVTALPEEAARRLVVEPVKGVLTFSDAAVTEAVRLVARQPFLLQCLCSRIFELAANIGQSSVTVDVVEKAADTLVADNEHFASLWDYSGSDRRRLILAICQREAEGPDALRLGVLEERLLRLGVSVTEAELTEDLEFLRELEVLDKAEESAGGAYHLAIPLMGLWIERQQDLDVLVSRARLESEDSHD